MTCPLSEDGKVAVKRRIELVLRVTDGNEVKHEVVKTFKPTWVPLDTPVEPLTPAGDPKSIEELITDSAAQYLKQEVKPALEELFDWMKANLK